MIPDLPNLSNPAVVATFVRPYNRDKAELVDYARGGVDLLDPSSGLNVKDWTCELQDGEVFISAQGVPPMLIASFSEDADWISLAFDQNMHYNLVYNLGESGSFLYWYDAEIQRYTTESLGRIRTPIIRMDDARMYTEGLNDIVLSYIRGTTLCVRLQRDRFKEEYTLASHAGTKIVQCGMNRKLRFQWYCL